MTDADRRPRLLILLGSLWPGNDASGANTSVCALAAALGADFDFRIVARDRPFGAAGALVSTGGWTAHGSFEVCYCRPGPAGTMRLLQLMRTTPYDLLVLNGFFDRDFTIPALLLRAAGLVPRRPALLSPRGEFSSGALALKGGRKRAWLSIVRLTHLLRGVVLHATGDGEREDIRAARLREADCVVAPNVIALPALPARKNAGGTPKLCFVGRLSPVKGLDVALTALAHVDATLRFDIFGPPADAGYVAQCRRLAAALPTHIAVHWHGAVAHDHVTAALAEADLLFLPSRSENFGHAIFEALARGTPVLIGDATPWRNLEADRAGFDLPADDPEAFAACLQRFAVFSPDRREKFRVGARARAARFVADSDAIARSRRMLQDAISGPRGKGSTDQAGPC